MMKKSTIYLNSANSIAERLYDSAIWDHDSCTWNVYAPDMKLISKTGNWINADSSLYQGVAGIGIFLCELYNITRQNKIKDLIIGAVKYCKKDMNKLKYNNYSFYSGKLGVLYFLCLSDKYLDSDYSKDEIDLILNDIKNNLDKNIVFDVISGCGGAIPALLKLYEMTGKQVAYDISCIMGEILIINANKWIEGWSWGAKICNDSVRNLCGFAHGASGIGFALLELYNMSKNERFLYAANKAFQYEDSFYCKDNSNWPDLRYHELIEYIQYGRIEELKKEIVKNNIPSYTPSYMLAWCHGAPGIGLARLRGYELTLNEQYLEKCIKSCELIIESLVTYRGNYSLCHGVFGNLELLVEASRVLKNEKYFDCVEKYTLNSLGLYGGGSKSWPCGTINTTNDPSLLLGEAGIGYFLLRLINESVPSIFALKTEKYITNITNGDNISELRANYINEYFGKTLKYIDHLEKSECFYLKKTNTNHNMMTDEIEAAYSYIKRYLSKLNGYKWNYLNDLFCLEKEVYYSSINNKEHSKEYIELLEINDISIDDLDESILYLHNECKLLKTEYDWEQYFTSNHVEPIKSTTYYILYKTTNIFSVKRITYFSFMLFTAIINPQEFNTIINDMKTKYEIDNKSEYPFVNKVKEQLWYGYINNIIKIKT
jgi:hypothetical protein